MNGYTMLAVTKTLIDLDDLVLQRALELSGETTKKAVVRLALEEFVRRRELGSYLDLLRSGVLDDLSDPAVIASAQR